jgi:hypothetical protein
MKITAFRNITQCSLTSTNISDQLAASIFRAEEYSSTLNMETVICIRRTLILGECSEIRDQNFVPNR